MNTFVTILLALCIAIPLVCETQTRRYAEQHEWPSITLPQAIHTLEAAEPMRLNGLLTQVQVFTSSLPVATVVEAFKTTLGEPLVQNTFGEHHILGRAISDAYYLTIDIEALPKNAAKNSAKNVAETSFSLSSSSASAGSKGIIGITRIQDRYEGGDQSIRVQSDGTIESIQPVYPAALSENTTGQHAWLAQLPINSRIYSDVQSEDNHGQTHHLVIINTQNLAVNTESITQLLKSKGFETVSRQEELIPLSNQQSNTSATSTPSHHMLFFKGNNKEAMATFTQHPSGHTSVVLNTLSTLEKFQ